jgi:hypothetical protein
MAQTTGAVNSVDARIETSPDGSAWTDHSGESVKLTPTGGDRQVGQRNTFDGDTPVVLTGKKDVSEVDVEYLYTEGASDLFEVARAAKEANSNFYIRWAPKGGQSGEFRFTTAVGKITEFQYPPIDAGAADPIALSFKLVNGGITKAVVP